MDNILKKKIVNKKTKKLPIDIILEEEAFPKNKTIKLSSFSKFIINRSRCKKGTKKYKSIGEGCYTNEEIEAFKTLNKISKSSNKKSKPKTKTKTKKKAIELEIVEDPIEIIDIVPEKRIDSEIKPKKKLTKRNLKIPIELEIMEEKKRYNEDFIELMENLSNIMYKQGEPFRARAYQKAQESIMAFPDDINSPSQLKGLPGIGSTIMEKLNEYVNTGTLKILEREKTNPINILAEIYGVGPKKAQELVNAGINSIDELKNRQNELLNNVQKIGLLYHDQIQQRIPRQEIEEFEKIFKNLFVKSTKGIQDSKFEIVGSYRRGAQSSGDIDVIITGKSDNGYKNFIDELISTGIILEILSRGPSKTLVIAKLPGDHIARRVDFLYSPLNEYPFAILYFTGSKIFNTVMRQHGLNKGFTFNEHGIYKLENKKKGELIKHDFKNEKDIFEFLNLEYKSPIERKDGRSVISKTNIQEIPKIDKSIELLQPEEQLEIIPVKKNKTLKKRKQKQELTMKEDENNVNNINDLQIIDNFKHNGITVLESLNEKQLSDILRLASSKYYNQKPVISDNQYDIIKEFLEQKFPNNVVLTEIGAEVERNKVKLPYEMASMDKIKPDTNALVNWMTKYSGPYIVSCKLDGVSGLYTTKGESPKLYTRGNGKVGQDVSHLIPFLRLPKTKGIVIRGEFIIPKDIFVKKYKGTFANPRNMVAGIVNHKHISESVVDLHFVAYEVILPELKPSEQMAYLETINVERVQYKTEDKLTNDLLSSLLIDWRKSYIYEIDGIIVTDDKLYPRKAGNPEHSFAFKMILSDQVAEAKVVDVLWTPSKDGYLKPRVQIEPINLGGVKIEYATGFNGAFIKDNNIGIGTTIELIRSGDVIPHIKSVTIPSEEPKMPSVPYKWNETHVDIMLENASDDPIVKEKNITGFFRGIGVDGLSTGNISKLILEGYDTVPKIIEMSEADFLTIEGFKGKMAKKLYTGIQQKIKEASIIKLMAASNIFGRGFSEKRLELILNDLPDIIISNEKRQEKIQSVKSLKGMAQKTAEAFVDKIDDFKNFIAECGLEDKLYEKPKVLSVDQTNPLFGKTIVLTGTREKQIIEYLKNIGAIQGSNVSKSTFLVVAKNKDDDTGKAEEARKLNIPIISVEEFIKTYIS